ncbi:hypothetical protein FKG94_24000 [Exilibacterium tricleocarpae]|uniref:Alpha/beta hydrolase domain-containing protein n=1 Tax=Exilibacterium tricleocarpae TaxID=2591008 RepID=A0A545ST63_9GAMM|nr:alpha/beta hydrolase domain-containing protein [Exilibacterium tricleocarpae]TQV68157.1 hypothetical protein FKG94_24000 [Exilibacterium tricleocarpae]
MKTTPATVRPLFLAMVLLIGAMNSITSLADPHDSVRVEAPMAAQGDIFSPGVRGVPATYVEEEFLLSGSATLFTYRNNPPLGPTDLVPQQAAVPFKTRAIVRRPTQPRHFNGAVVIEWWNSTAGFDTAPVWDASADYFTGRGFIYVGITNSTTAIDFLAGGCRLLGVAPPACGTRYQTLSLPENGLAYEMVSQITNLLKSRAAENPIPRRYTVRRTYHAGQSQQGGSVVTYASAFHIPATDGYFIQAAVNPRPINFGINCNAPGAPPFPACTPGLQGADALVRTDLPVPVVQAITETDVAVLFGTSGRQPDTPTYRYYEMAGVAHLTAHKNIELLPAGLLGPDPVFIEDLCARPMNTTADGPVLGSYLLNAMWNNLENQVRRGLPPPSGKLLDTLDERTINRDTFGNARGGLRLPNLDVPVAGYLPTNAVAPNLPSPLQNSARLACTLAGSFTPFDETLLAQLYPSRRQFAKPFFLNTLSLLYRRFLLPEDAIALLQDNLEP